MIELPDADARVLVRLERLAVAEARRQGLSLNVVDVFARLRRQLRTVEYAAPVPSRLVTGSVSVPDGWLTTADVGDRLGLTARAVTKRAKNRRHRAVKVGRQWWHHPEVLSDERTGAHQGDDEGAWCS